MLCTQLVPNQCFTPPPTAAAVPWVLCLLGRIPGLHGRQARAVGLRAGQPAGAPGIASTGLPSSRLALPVCLQPWGFYKNAPILVTPIISLKAGSLTGSGYSWY